MISFEDFEKEDGQIDWGAYRKAQVDAGEICSQCGHIIIFAKGYRTSCNDCERLNSSKDRVDHGKYIRCPACRDTFDPWEDGYYGLLEDGEHSVCCVHCSHDFEIITHISFTFESPALLETEMEPDGD